MVMGIAMPGLKESFGLNSEDFKEVSEDIQLPESVEITADVTNLQWDRRLQLHCQIFLTMLIGKT